MYFCNTKIIFVLKLNSILLSNFGKIMKDTNSPKSNLGRPRGLNNKSLIKTFRFTNDEWNSFYDSFVKSAFSSKVEYILALTKKNSHVKKQNIITFDTYVELKKLRTEINRIGVNVNQITTKIHTLDENEDTVLGYSLRQILDELRLVEAVFSDYSSKMLDLIKEDIEK